MENSTGNSDSSTTKKERSHRGKGDWAIIIYKGFSGLLSIFVGIVFLGLTDENLTAIGQQIGATLGLSADSPLVSAIADLVSGITSQELVVLALISFTLGVLSITGAVGMALGKDWGDILVIITLAIFIPIEIASLLSGFSIVTLIIFILDVTIVWYLVARLLRKRQGTEATTQQTT